MIKDGFSVFRGKRVLLLQGPIGPFFRRFARDLTLAGAQVFKVNFNGGDWLFYPSGAFHFRGRMDAWPDYFEELLDQLHVDIVMLFGDCRSIHRVAHEIAHKRGLDIGVFEEGYVRPDYITFEWFGVNGHSLIPRSPIFFLNKQPINIQPPLPVGNTFWFASLWAAMYYLAADLFRLFFPYYRHHRPLTCLELLPWLRSMWRKGYYMLKERGVFSRLKKELKGRFFLVPLQVYNDAQIHTHSDFYAVTDFIDGVMTSFANYALQHHALVIKHHPLDRGYSDYARFISRRAKELGLQGRCYYIHDQHLPTLLKCARGVIVINSTVGLSALFHGTPTKVCGNALYNIKGLTFQGKLDDFWQRIRMAKPDRHLFKSFYNYLVQRTQLNGSFYRRLPIVASDTGLRVSFVEKMGESAIKQTNERFPQRMNHP